jgi:hypothetical protein
MGAFQQPVHPPRRYDLSTTTDPATMPPRPQDLWRWLVTILDDVLVEKFWYRLRRGDARGALRAITEIVTGFAGCWLVLTVLTLVGVLLVGVR